MRPKGTMSHFFGLLGLCGVSTFLMGAVTGGFFGDMIPQVLKILNPESTFVWFWPPLFTPLDDTLMILVGAMALGLIQIVTGMAISFIKKDQGGADPGCGMGGADLVDRLCRSGPGSAGGDQRGHHPGRRHGAGGLGLERQGLW